MFETPHLFVCPICFRECDSPEKCHAHTMLECWPGREGSFRRRPIASLNGQLFSTAPLWFLEASGWLSAVAPFSIWRR